MQIHVKTKDLDQPIVQDIPNNIVIDKLKEHLLIEFTEIDKDNIELLVNDFKQALDQFGHFHFIHIQSNRGESVDIIF